MESLNDTLDRYSSPRNMLVTFNLLPFFHVLLFKISDRSVLLGELLKYLPPPQKKRTLI